MPTFATTFRVFLNGRPWETTVEIEYDADGPNSYQVLAAFDGDGDGEPAEGDTLTAIEAAIEPEEIAAACEGHRVERLEEAARVV